MDGLVDHADRGAGIGWLLRVASSGRCIETHPGWSRRTTSAGRALIDISWSRRGFERSKAYCMDDIKALNRQYVVWCFGVDGSGELGRLVGAALRRLGIRRGNHGRHAPVLAWPTPPFPAEPPRRVWGLLVATGRPEIPERPRKSWSSGRRVPCPRHQGREPSSPTTGPRNRPRDVRSATTASRPVPFVLSPPTGVPPGSEPTGPIHPAANEA